MKDERDLTIGVTMGDPSGIGPEIILKSFSDSSIGDRRIIVIGDFSVMLAAHRLLNTDTFQLNRVFAVEEARFERGLLNILDLRLVDMESFQPGQVQAVSGNAAYECIRKAIGLAGNKEVDTVVTAPIHKEALQLAGHSYPGHTELFAELTNTRDYAMLLHDSKLSVIHVSTHVSMLEAIKGLKKRRIEKVIALANEAMKKLGCHQPRIAVAGINPHAGENGLFGNEEIREISPAVERMKARGINVEGPFPPDTVFLNAVNGVYDIVVAMYHDQGHIPLKLLGFNTGVNVTVGLPFIRTSVDHGTAFDIAWQGKASERSMIEAISLAIRLSSGDQK